VTTILSAEKKNLPQILIFFIGEKQPLICVGTSSISTKIFQFLARMQRMQSWLLSRSPLGKSPSSHRSSLVVPSLVLCLLVISLIGSGDELQSSLAV
jgi:hypothetical protein